MKYYTLILILVLYDNVIGQDILQDGENLLEDMETGTEEAVTEIEMEDVTMTTPITTPAAREVSNKVIVTTPAPVVDTENEESLNEEQDLEMNQESISQEKVPRKLSVIVEDDVYDVADDVSEDADDISDDYNEIEDRSDKDDISSEADANNNGWFYFSNSHPGVVPLYHTVQKFPYSSPKHLHPQSYIPKFQWTYPHQWASKPSSKRIGNYPFGYPYVYYSINSKIGVDNNQNV